MHGMHMCSETHQQYNNTCLYGVNLAVSQTINFRVLYRHCRKYITCTIPIDGKKMDNLLSLQSIYFLKIHACCIEKAGALRLVYYSIIN